MGADRTGEFRLAPLAEQDLDDIWSFTVEKWSWKQAQKYHAELLRGFHDLADGHAKGRAIDVRPGYLKYPVGSHFVFYRQRAFGIEIIRVLHRRMDVGRHLQAVRQIGSVLSSGCNRGVRHAFRFHCKIS
jgi:toxin ParE1/3/4